MSEVDTSAVPSVRARLAELQLQQQQPTAKFKKPPPPLPPRKPQPPLPPKQGQEATTKPSLPPRRATQTQPSPEGLQHAKSTPAPTTLPKAPIATRKLPPREIPPLPSRPAEPVKTPSLPARPRSQKPSLTSVRTLSPRVSPPSPSSPPPVPTSTRPVTSTTGSPGAATCLRHRSFAEADAHAGLTHPTHTLRALASSLTAPFPSSTDKARVIFVYLHHHIAYDFSGFLGHTQMGAQDALSVLRSGKSVCQGYAELFLALAELVGLEAALVSGHGKGYGYSKDVQIPYPPDGHAWNAVRLDGGEWRLIDACWGAGAVDQSAGYTKRFNEAYFLSTPEEFGMDHFPSDKKWLLTNKTWEEYQIPRVAPTACCALEEHGYAERAVSPASIGGSGWYRFEVMKGPCECLPYQEEAGGEYLLFILVGEGMDKERCTVMRREGRWCRADVYVQEGQRVTLQYVLQWEGRDGRGVSAETWEQKIGRVSWSWGQMVSWE